MTKLTSAIHRETAKCYSNRPVIVTLAPAGSQSEALIGLRLKGKRTMYILALSDCYRIAAMNYGLKMKRAKSEARKSGEPWRKAKKKFDAQNRI